ncbi:acyltransferase family protein [Stutzerimonas stutzeri]|uniref:acyltransferase family protein n=1 Tax=Stutzerimonas stutzeri TaxID=316 RepID=UPI001C2EC6B7|nr:acyltransferase family protein [Stutzerimonas stutzeri]
MKYVPGIDGLRAVAVLSVLLFHAGFTSFSGGYVGVDVFFVISGYLITRLISDEVTQKGSFDFPNFYYRRVRRLFPALFTTLAICLILSFLLFTPQHFQRFGGELTYSIFSLSNFFFWSESGYFDTSSDFKPLLHTWSLSVEEQFYMLWPALLVLLLRAKSKAIVLFALAAAFAVSLGLNLVFADGQSSTLSSLAPTVAGWFSDGASTIFYLTPFRVFEFAVGAAIVWLPRPGEKHRALSEASMTAGLLMIGISIFTFTEKTAFPSYNALIPCIGAALVIYGVNAPTTGLLLRNGLMVWIGLISYSVYLVHWPLIVFYRYWSSQPLALHEQVAIVTISISLGFAMFRLVETPMRRAPGSTYKPNKAAFGLSCAMLAMFLVLPASSIWASSGWEWRIGESRKKLAEQLGDSKQFHIDNYGGAGYTASGWINVGKKPIADLVVIGDSHARHYATGLDQIIGKPFSKNIFISSASCLVLPGMTRVTPGTDWDSACSGALSKAITAIENNPNSVVMIGESWQFQLNAAGEIGEGKPLKHGNSADGYRFITKKLDKLRAKIGNRQLIIVGNVPGAGTSDTMGCFLRPSFIQSNCFSLLNVPVRAIESAVGNKILAQYASARPNTIFLDPFDAFCANGLCSSAGDDAVYYSDALHLSKAGSVRAISHFKEAVLAALDRRSDGTSLQQVKAANAH